MCQRGGAMVLCVMQQGCRESRIAFRESGPGWPRFGYCQTIRGYSHTRGDSPTQCTEVPGTFSSRFELKNSYSSASWDVGTKLGPSICPVDGGTLKPSAGIDAMPHSLWWILDGSLFRLVYPYALVVSTYSSRPSPLYLPRFAAGSKAGKKGRTPLPKITNPHLGSRPPRIPLYNINSFISISPSLPNKKLQTHQSQHPLSREAPRTSAPNRPTR